jgi:sugar lactone lactonase YvrE
MDNDERARSGAFYCFADGKLTPTGIDDIAITNGPAVSPDGRHLYLVDTLKGTIEIADINDDGRVENRSSFVRIEKTDGYPDGPTIDSNGYLWISLYAGWEVRRYSPTGDLVERVRFPVANITKIAFGGANLRTAYATTARQLLKPDDIAKQPQIGDLFEFRVDVPGVPCPSVSY